MGPWFLLRHDGVRLTGFLHQRLCARVVGSFVEHALVEHALVELVEHALVGSFVEHTLVEHTLCPSRQHGQTASRGAVFPIAFPRPGEM